MTETMETRPRRLPYNTAFARCPETRECWRILRRNGISRATAATAFGIGASTARKLDKAARCIGCGEFATSDDSET